MCVLTLLIKVGEGVLWNKIFKLLKTEIVYIGSRYICTFPDKNSKLQEIQEIFLTLSENY